MQRDKRAAAKLRLSHLTSTHPQPDANVSRQIGQLEAELRTLETDDAAHEASVEALKRQKVKEAFEIKFEALRKAGEKQALIAGYGMLLIAGLARPASESYDGASRTATVREGAEDALDNWNAKKPLIPPPTLGSPSVHHGDSRYAMNTQRFPPCANMSE